MTFASVFISIVVLMHVFSSNVDCSKEMDNKMNNVMKKLFQMSSPEEIKNLGIKLEKINKPSSIIGRVGKGPASIIAGDVKDATPGKCDPKPVCISNPLIVNLTSSQLAFPPCINIHRCDGCCPTNEKCEPVKSHEVRLQKVGIIDFQTEDSAKYTDSFVSVLNHTECQCKCQWESDADCKAVNPNFVKSSSYCECVCPEELNCGVFHEFDRTSCSCKCKSRTFGRMEQICKSRNFVWNDVLCKCDSVKYSISAKEIKID